MCPEIKGRVPPPHRKFVILCSLFPIIIFVLLFPSKVGLTFPFTWDAIFPVPKTPGRATSISNFRFSLNKIRRLHLLYSWSQYCLLQRNTNAVDLMYYMTTHPGVAQNRKKRWKKTVGRSSIFREGKQCLHVSNSPEISLITFILLFYFIIMFLSLFNRSLSRLIMFWLFQCGMCDQQSHRSACAYAQSGQSLC